MRLREQTLATDLALFVGERLALLIVMRRCAPADCTQRSAKLLKAWDCTEVVARELARFEERGQSSGAVRWKC